MNARTWKALVASSAMIGSFLAPRVSIAQSNVARCRADIAGAVLGGMKQSEKDFARCAKTGDYCYNAVNANYAGDDLSIAIQGVDSACVAAAVLDGVAAEDLVLPECPRAWHECTSYEPANLNLVDYCETCLSIGLNQRLAFDLDLSFNSFSDATETQRQCIGGVYRALSRAARRGLEDATKCALDAGDPPWSCSTDPQSDTKLAKMLTRIDRAALRCDAALDEPGSIVPTLCNGPSATASDLAECARRTAVCRACQAANFTLGLEQDCVAQSGDRLCDASFGGDFGRPDPGSVFVTNEGDDSITYYGNDLSYVNGTLAASSFPVGDGPVDVAINADLGLAYVVNRADATLSILQARSGEPAFGDLANSTFAVGAMPSAVALHAGLGIVYVANEADGTITMFDGSNGTYLNDTLAASSLPSGRGPSSIAVDETNGIVFVANADDDTVTFLRARDGQPYFTSLAASTFPVGDEPVDVSYGAYAGLLFVTNHGDGTVTTLDAATGAPAYGTLAASTRNVGTGPVASAFQWTGVYTGLDEGSAMTGWVGTPHETVYGPVGSESVSTDGPVSDVLIDYYGRLLATLRTADELGQAYTEGYTALFGRSAVEDAIVAANDYAADDVAVEPVSGAFLITGYFYPPNEGAIGVIDPTAKSVTYKGALTAGGRIAYNPSADIVFISERYGRDIILLQGATGNYLNGTLEASTVASVCNNTIDSMAYAPASNTLFVRCYQELVYLDGTTGAFRTGSKATSFVPLTRYSGEIAIDEAADRIFVEDDDFSNSYVVALTISSVGYANGTLAASRIISGSGDGLAVDPATGILYRGNSNGTVTLHDLSGNLLTTAALPASPGGNIRLSVNSANGILYVSRTYVYRPGIDLDLDDVVYLNASDGSYLNTNLDDSSVIVGPSRGIAAAKVSAATSTIGIPVHTSYLPGVLILDADEPVAKGERRAFDRTVPTGASPSAVAMVPWY